MSRRTKIIVAVSSVTRLITIEQGAKLNFDAPLFVMVQYSYENDARLYRR